MAKIRITWTDDEFIEKFDSSSTLKELQIALGFKGHGGVSNARVKGEIERLGLDFDKFNIRSKTSYQSVKERNSSYQARWYKDNKQKAFEARIKYKEEIRKVKQEFMMEYLQSNPCIDCGEDDPIVLEFDHIDEKNFTIGHTWQIGHSLETLKKEIELCEVRCANCHKRKTTLQLGWWKGNGNS